MISWRDLRKKDPTAAPEYDEETEEWLSEMDSEPDAELDIEAAQAKIDRRGRQ
jgi:hypothetical protein